VVEAAATLEADESEPEEENGDEAAEAELEEAQAEVERYADLGYVQIKVYSSIKPELVPTIIELLGQTAPAELSGRSLLSSIPGVVVSN
jgi:hypothetical protein